MQYVYENLYALNEPVMLRTGYAIATLIIKCKNGREKNISFAIAIQNCCYDDWLLILADGRLGGDNLW